MQAKNPNSGDSPKDSSKPSLASGSRGLGLSGLLKSDRSVLGLCMLASFLFWFFSKMAQPHRDQTELRLNYELPEGKILREKQPLTVVLSYQAPGWDLLRGRWRHSQGDFKVEVPAEAARNEVEYNLEAALRDHLSKQGLSYISVSVSQLKLWLDDTASVYLPVEPDLQLRLPPNIQLRQNPVCQPAKVLVKGPASVLKYLTSVKTQPIIVEKTQTHSLNALLLSPDKLPLSFEPSEIKCRIEPELVTEKSFQVPIQILHPEKERFDVYPRTAKLSLTVRASVFEQVQASDFELQVDLRDLDPSEPSFSQNRLPLQLVRQSPLVSGTVLISPNVVSIIVLNN